MIVSRSGLTARFSLASLPARSRRTRQRIPGSQRRAVRSAPSTRSRVTLYLQLGQGFSAIGAGLALVPWSLGMAIGAGVGVAVLGPKLGRPTLHLGLIVMLAGILGMLAVVHGGGADVSAWALVGP